MNEWMNEWMNEGKSQEVLSIKLWIYEEVRMAEYDFNILEANCTLITHLNVIYHQEREPCYQKRWTSICEQHL